MCDFYMIEVMIVLAVLISINALLTYALAKISKFGMANAITMFIFMTAFTFLVLVFATFAVFAWHLAT